MRKTHHNVSKLEALEHLISGICGIEPYENMSRKNLIECCTVHDQHHQHHHELQEKQEKRIDELLGHSNKQLEEIRALRRINKELVEQGMVYSDVDICVSKTAQNDTQADLSVENDRQKTDDDIPHILWIEKGNIQLTLEDTMEGQGYKYILDQGAVK